MLKIVSLILLVVSSSLANYSKTYNMDTVKADFKSQDTDKYKRDSLHVFSLNALIEKEVFTKEQTLVGKWKSESFDLVTITEYGACEQIGKKYTGTIYDIDLKSGEITCMFSLVGDLYSPIGLFKITYPEMKKYFSLDKDSAEKKNAEVIEKSVKQFTPIFEYRKSFAKSVESENSDTTYLTIPQLLTAGILTDTGIIDVEASRATNKLQLQNQFTSKYTVDEKSGKKFDNTQYILTDIETIFGAYSNLSKLSINYLIFLVAFFGIYGVGRAFLSPMADKLEGKQSSEKNIPYGVGVFLGVLLFFPSNDHESINNPDGSEIAQFEIMKTRYQDFEKLGYYLFGEWADDAAKAIIDEEMDGIIDKSGIGTKEQIINSAASMEQNDKLRMFYRDYNTQCKLHFYSAQNLVDSNGNSVYSVAQNAIFPTSESWAWATKLAKSQSNDYYRHFPYGLVLTEGYSVGKQQSLKEGELLDDYYPMVSVSSCGKAFYNEETYSKLSYEHKLELDRLSQEEGSDEIKINMLKKLIEFQYGLYRDWGYLSILGLPITKMQTEYIGGLYKNRRSEVLDALEKDVKDDSFGAHAIMSTIPYMFVPGAGSVFSSSLAISNKIKDSLDDSLAGSALKLFGGGVATSLAGSVLGLKAGFEITKTVLSLTPIIAIVIIGLVRFIIIMIKIFSFHFASLFLMPVMFARENIRALSNFTMKIFATMLELPIFVLAVWLAITANSLIHNIGDVFSKKIILGMLENNEAQYEGLTFKFFDNSWLSKLKIYVFDGFMEVSIAIFSVVIIYKLIITLHNTLFEVLEIQGSQSLDNSIESMKNESSGWGSRI